MRTLLAAAAALLALVLLASTLNALRLDPGVNLPLSELAPRFPPPASPSGLENFLLQAMRVMLILLWASVPVLVILLIVSKEARKRFLRDLLTFLPIFILIYLLSRRRSEGGVIEDFGAEIMNPDTLSTTVPELTAPLPVYSPPADWVTSAISIALAVVIALLILIAAWAIYQRSRLRPGPLQRIEDEAAAAIEAIEAGGDLSEVIIRCYFQMMDALKQYRNISRERDMTPHEFESYLAMRGLPRPPVQRLTQLFEQVRYGDVRPGRAEERAAIESLKALIAAIQRERGDAPGERRAAA